MSRLPIVLSAILCVNLQGCMSYPVVAVFDKYNEVARGRVDGDLLTGTAYIEVQGQVTKSVCKGNSHVTYIPPISYVLPVCAGQAGETLLRCDDGRTIRAQWRANSCTSGIGSGADQDGHRLSFAFGMSDSEANEFVKKELELAKRRPDLPIGPWAPTTASLAEINEVYRRVDRMWQLEYQKTEDEFRYRVVEADYATTIQAIRKAFIELGMPVQKASTDTGVIRAENNAPTPLTKEEWAQVIKVENQNPSLPEIAGRRFEIAEDPSSWVVIIRAVVRKVSSDKTFVLLEHELEVPRFRGTGVEPNKQAPPLAVQVGSTKFWNQLSRELEKINVPTPRRRTRDEFAI